MDKKSFTSALLEDPDIPASPPGVAPAENPPDPYQDFIENMSEGFLVSDREGVAISYNQAFAGFVKNYLGTEIMPGLKIRELFADEKRIGWEKAYQQVLSGENLRMRDSFSVGNGRYHTYEFLFSPGVTHGRVIGFTQTIRLLEETDQAMIIPQIVGERYARSLEENPNLALFSLVQKKGATPHLLYITDPLIRLLEISSPPVTFEKCMERFHLEDRAFIEERLRNWHSTGEPEGGFVRIKKTQERAQRWVRVEWVISDDPKNNCRYCDGIAIDLSDSVREIIARSQEPEPAPDPGAAARDNGHFLFGAREALQRAPRDILWDYFQHSRTELVFCDRDGFPVLFNNAFARKAHKAFGIQMQPGIKPHKTLPPEQQKAWDDIYDQALQGFPQARKIRLTFPDGSSRQYESFIYPEDLDGKPNGFFEVSRPVGKGGFNHGLIDFISAMVETSFDFFVFSLRVDMKGKDEPQILFVSPNMADMFGIPDPMRFGQWLDMVHPEDLASLREDLQARPLNPGIHDHVRVRGPEGEWRYFRLDLMVSGNSVSGETVIYGVGFDISEFQNLPFDHPRSHVEAKTPADGMDQIGTMISTLLKKKEDDQKRMEATLRFNLKQKIEPFIDRLKDSGLTRRQVELLEIIEENIHDVCEPLLHNLTLAGHRLTPTEVRVAELIRKGLRSREIAELLNLSRRTVDTHRKNLRGKLGLQNTRKNLRTHLLSLA